MPPRPSHSLRRPSALALAMVIGASCASVAAPAHAEGPDVIVAAPVNERAGVAKFDLEAVPAARIRSARLTKDGRARGLAGPRLRKAARRGTLRVRTPGGHQKGSASATAPARLRIRLAAGRSPRLYSDRSPFNTRISAAPRVDPASRTLLSGILRARRDRGFVFTTKEWTVPVYFADATTPRHTVALAKAPPQWASAYGTPQGFRASPPGLATDYSWLHPPMTSMVDVPIPAGARPDPEADSHMTVIDRSTGCEYDLYGASTSGGRWSAVWANATRTTGTGVYASGLSSKGTGMAGAAGLIWPEELESGRIDHALFFAYPYTRSGGPVAPATASDGQVKSADAIPQGARLQLDPSLDLDGLGLSRHERTIARAIQEYGMILSDTGGAASVYGVASQSFGGKPYGNEVPADGYEYLDKIPMSKLRVLQMPPQEPRRSLGLVDTGCGQYR